MPMHFLNPIALALLWLVALAVVLQVHSARKRRKALSAFGSAWVSTGRKREAICQCLALGLTIVALARPAWNLEERQLEETGRDVVFLLDVSRSMLAEDMHPNRLENAKTAILDCIEELTGDRIGLVLFAGSAEIRCPLTLDYAYFRMALRQASPDNVGVGGTMIGHAIERTAEKLLDVERAGMQDVILITDGEDLVEGADETEAVKMLEDAGARFIAIGIGDRKRGGRIAVEGDEPASRTFLKHGNTEVWTRLQSETLRRMAGAIHNGIYFEVANGPFDLASIYRQIMQDAHRTATNAQVVERYEEKYPLFLSAAVVSLLLSHRWRREP